VRSPGLHFGIGLGLLGLLSVVVSVWVVSASGRVSSPDTDSPVAVATASDEGYCKGELKAILRRVLTSCGLTKANGARGCQPLEARTVAALSGDDFNALFLPLKERVAILQFDMDEAGLDEAARGLLEKAFSDQRGASYFLVVARASPEGSVTHNSDLSQQRAGAVLDHLSQTFSDPDLEQEVGLLWLGEEFAQLDQDFCGWTRSRPGSPCTPEDINRSAFIAWIDCRL
jgi:outer membrane protein OmpA-like peptidoglycan-associated protein